MDNFFVNWIRKREADGVPASTRPETPKQTEQPGGTYQERIVHVRNAGLSLTVPAVYRAIELRAKTEAQFAIQCQMLHKAGGNYVQDPTNPGRALNYLLQLQPNPISSISNLISQVVIDRLTNGNAFVYIERDHWRDPVAFWIAECAGYNQFSGTYSLTYQDQYGIQKNVEAPREDVLHFPNTFKQQNGFWGIGTLRYAYDTLSLIKTQTSQALETVAKGGRMKLVIGEEKPAQSAGTLAYGLLGKEHIDKYAEELSQKVYQQDVVGIRGLNALHNISMTSQDMQVMEHLNMGLDDVARFFGTPRPLLMLDSNSHYTTYTNATLEYLQRTVQPDIIEMEQEFNRKLLSRSDFGKRRIHFCEQPLLRLDKEAQAKVDQLQLQTGAATVNEIRAQYDRPSVEGGDIVYVSTNLAELGSEKLRGGSQPTIELEP